LAQVASNHYSAEIDFSKNAKNFQNIGGLYSVELLIADALIENPLTISLVDIKLNFGEEQQSVDQQNLKANLYSKKPEIKHLFRQSEPMPPAIVSTVFAVMCLVPLVIMLFLWMRIGFNFSKFSFSLSGLIFHGTLAAIFGLYYLYWVQLDMFQTIKYLAILSGLALVFGNRLLSSLASHK